MLSKEHRLQKRTDIQKVLKGKSVFDPICGVKLSKNGLPDSRFAIVAGLKVHKSAVKRNTVRRQYSEIIRLNLQSIEPGYDFVLLISKASLDVPYAEKEAQLIDVLKKAKVWTGKSA
ncbi:MAG: ribonuclease P protein component [Patescibacteria group bacterium]|jgi:ribonuclease P protein component